MAFLSSVFGTALGSAAKVGSEAIREARERDRTAVAEFKKNIQAKKAAFAKQQAEAKKANEKVQTVANFLQGQYKDKKFNALELQDLAKQLIGISPENPQKYFLENMDKIDFMPSKVMMPVETKVPTGGMKDVGLVDGQPIEAQPEFQKEKVDLPLSLFQQQPKEKEKPVARQTASLLEPVRKKSFFAEALTGKDMGTIQRESLRDLNMTEGEFNSLLAGIPDTYSKQRPPTATFGFQKVKPKDTFTMEQVVKKHNTIEEMIRNNPNAKLPENVYTYTKDVVEKTGLPGPQGEIVVKKEFKEQITLGYEKLWDAYSQMGESDRLDFAPEMLKAQNDYLTKSAIMGRHKGLHASISKLSDKKYDKIVELNMTLSEEEKSRLKFDENFRKIEDNKTRLLLLASNDANYEEASNLALETNTLINDLFLDVKANIDNDTFKKDFGFVLDKITKLVTKAGVSSQFSSEEDRLKVLGDGTTENIGFTGRYIDAVRNKDERALRLLNSDVEEVFANLKVAGANEEETKFKETTNMIIKDWEERNNRTATDKVKRNAEQAARVHLFGGKVIKSGDGFVMQMPVAGSMDGQSSLIMKDVPLYIESNGELRKQFAGVTKKSIQEMRESNGKILGSLEITGKIMRMLQQDGLLLGGVGDLRAAYYNFTDTLDIAAQRVANSDIFKGLTDRETQVMLSEVRRLAVSFVSVAKNELFDDPRLSDQDLALVLNYIGVLNTAQDKGKIIGQASAVAALIGLERIFAKQRAITKFVIAGDTGEPAYKEGDYTWDGQKGNVYINLDKKNLATETFFEIAASRGIDVNKFGKFREVRRPDGQLVKTELIGFDSDKAFAYFKKGGTYGFGRDGEPLDGEAAALALIKDIDSIHRQTHEIMREVVAYSTMDNSEFRARSRTAGTYGAIDTSLKGEKQARDLIASLGLTEAFEKSGRSYIGVKL